MSDTEQSSSNPVFEKIYPPGACIEDDDFELSREEVDRFKDALQHEEFRKLLVDYVDDIQSVESQTTYQKEVKELERQNGNIVHFLNPVPGYVLKTSVDGCKKAFINICSNPLIKKAEVVTSKRDHEGRGIQWSIPYAQSPAKEDYDKSRALCVVYDVIFHPDSLYMAQKNSAFQEKIEEIAVEGVESSFKVKLDRNNIKRPKLKYKGASKATILRYKIGEPLPTILDASAIDEELPPQDIRTKSSSNKDEVTKTCVEPMKLDKHKNEETKIIPTEPRYSFKYRSHVDLQDCCLDNQRSGRSFSTIPDEIILTVDLPLLSEASMLDADVLEDGYNFFLKSNKKAFYELDLRLPFKVEPESASAKFDKDKRKLYVTMKTVKKTAVLLKKASDELLETSEGSMDDERNNSNDTDDDIPSASDDISQLLSVETASRSNYASKSTTKAFPQEKYCKLEESDVEKREKDIGYESNESTENLPKLEILNGFVVTKSILKTRSRSLSESWIDHLDHLKLEDFNSLESLSESNEAMGSEDNSVSEKNVHVRFNEQVQRQLFRSNSSILGQRRKNQRKNKKKRIARERHHSEGSMSSFDEDEKQIVN